jgi:hypothetical protein
MSTIKTKWQYFNDKNDLTLPLDFRKLAYQKFPDAKLVVTEPNILGSMYNDKMDDGKNDLSRINFRGWNNFAWCFYKLDPGHWVPPHVDHFINYAKYYGIKDTTKIQRILMFLEDWYPGQVFGVDDKVFLKWKKYDYVTWQNGTEHWGGNFGNNIRYTLQLTGYDNS